MNVYISGVKLLIELIQEVKPIYKKEVRYIFICTKKVRYISVSGFIQKSLLPYWQTSYMCVATSGISYFSLYLYTKNYPLMTS